MKHYKIPFWSKVALWIARALPDRVYAWAMICAYDNLDKHYHWAHEVHKDGTETHWDVVSAVRIEKLRRELYREWLKATTYEKEKAK